MHNNKVEREKGKPSQEGCSLMNTGFTNSCVVLGHPCAVEQGEPLTLCSPPPPPQADLIIVLGSSLRVTPAADVPQVVKEKGGRLVICK